MRTTCFDNMWSNLHILVTISLFGIMLSAAAAEQPRFWRLEDSPEVNGTFVREEEGSLVLKLRDETETRLNFAGLIPSDREYVKVLRARKESADSRPVSPASAEPEPDLSPLECDADMLIAAADEPYRKEVLPEKWRSDLAVCLFNGLAFADDGSRLVACLRQGGYVVFNGETGDVLHLHTQPFAAAILHVAVSGQGELAAFALENGSVVVVDLKSDKIMHTHPATPGRILGVHLSPDARRVSWFSEKLTLHSDRLAGGDKMEVTYPDESRMLSPEKFQQLDATERDDYLRNEIQLVHDPYALQFAPDGLAAFLIPREIGYTYAEIYLPRQNEPGIISKRSLKESSPRQFAFTPEYAAFLDEDGGIDLFTRDGMHRHDVQVSELTGFCDNRIEMGISTAKDEALYLIGRGQVEIRPLSFMFLSKVYDFPVHTPQQIALAMAGKRFAVVDSNGALRIFDLPSVATCAGYRFMQTLRELLRRKQFDTLNTIFDKLNQRSSQTFQWSREPIDSLLVVIAAYQRRPWYLKGDDMQAFATEWLQQCPDSPAAITVATEVMNNLAREARGDGIADKVTEEGWEIFRKRTAEAKEKILELLKSDRPPQLAFYELFRIAQAESWSQAQMQPYIERLEELYPNDSLSHSRIASNLMPRWGGEPRDAVAYTEKIANRRGAGAGDAFYALMANKITNCYAKSDFFDLYGFDYERIQAGWRYLQEQDAAPDRGILGEMWFARIKKDDARLEALIKRVMTEKIPFARRVLHSRLNYRNFMDDFSRPRIRALRTRMLALNTSDSAESAEATDTSKSTESTNAADTSGAAIATNTAEADDDASATQASNWGCGHAN